MSASPLPTERLRFSVPATARSAVAARLARAGADPRRPVVVVHPGASAASRRYPAARFGIAAERIARASDATVVLSGAVEERPLIEEMRAAMTVPAISLAGQLDLGELAALIEARRRARRQQQRPGAPRRGARHAGRRSLCAHQSAAHAVAGRRRASSTTAVPCRNCLKSRCPQGHHDCLRRVAPEAVADAAIELLAPRLRAKAGVASLVESLR